MAKNIVIIGVGALGSHLALFGRNLGNIKVVDFDFVESKNILSQFHTAMGKGQKKAHAIQKAFHGLFSIKVEANTNKVTRDNAHAVIGTPDLIIDCTDNLAARKVITAYVRSKGIPCLHGALSADGTFARIIWSDHFVPDEEGVPGQATCEDGENLPFHGLAASQMAIVVQRFFRKGDRQSFQVTPAGAIRLT